jgi:hypothetical protein
VSQCATSLCLVLAIAFSTVSAALRAQWGPLQTNEYAGAALARAARVRHCDNRTLMFGGNGTNEFWSLSGGTVDPADKRRDPAVGALTREPRPEPDHGEYLLYGGDDGSSQFASDETGSGTARLASSRRRQTRRAAGPPWHGLRFARGVDCALRCRRNSWIQNVQLRRDVGVREGNWTQVT